MTYGIASLISCLLFPLVGWLAMVLSKRTIYRPIASEEGAQHDEQAERDKVRDMREKQVRKVFVIYGVIVGVLFMAAALTVPAKKVHAALWPTATPTVTNTRTPTKTPTVTNTPRNTNTPKAENFLTNIAVSGTTSATLKANTLAPSNSGAGSVTIIQTRIVIQTRIAVVTQIVYVPMTVFVTITNTPLFTPTIGTGTSTPTPTETETVTPTAIFTPTETPTP